MADREKGVDNPATKEDEGSSLLPDLVISVQQSQGRTLAELPASTTDLQSSSTGQCIPIHGLDLLIGATSLQIKKILDLSVFDSPIDLERRYIVKIPQGESLYKASEVSSLYQRSAFVRGRGFVLHLHDSNQQEAMVFERRLASTSCLFPCRLQEMKVLISPGQYIGRIQQRWWFMVPLYSVRDVNDDVLYVIKGPVLMNNFDYQESEFKILTGDSLHEVGSISHSWDRELVSFITNIIYPNIAVQPKHKALILGAAFLLDYIYF